MRSTTGFAFALIVALGGASACGGPEPKMVAAKDDGVPANSASEERLNGGPKPTSEATTDDPTQPLMTPMPMPTDSGKAGKGTATKVTKAECKQLFDKYIDLTIATDTRYQGIPPELIDQMKEAALAQAESEKGDPCSTHEVSRTQYACAIASTSTAAWTRCLK